MRGALASAGIANPPCVRHCRGQGGPGITDERIDHGPWPMRAPILAAAGVLCGLAVHLLIRAGAGYSWEWTDSIPRLSLAIFVASGGILLAYTLERVRWAWSLGFALAGGAVVGGLYYWNGSPAHHGSDDAMRSFASLFAIGIAAPLFQTMRDEGARRLPYRAVHAHSWANVVLWFASWTFVGIAWLLIWLLSELFRLIGLNFLHDLLDRAWFGWVWTGGALGAGIALLRERDRVLGLLQRVVTTVLSVFAPVLAFGLVLFVLALPFTGLDALWEQTRATTPILLGAAIWAIILANAVIGNAPEEEAQIPLLRYSAMALGGVMLPLVAVAAVSTAIRINQHGLTPTRLWGMVSVAVAAAYAMLYLYALVRGRAGWALYVRPANIRIAIGLCLLALFLATPLAQFGPMSTRSQLSRLESGAVSAEQFDWAALRFDFGPAGVAALERLKAAGPPAQRRYATQALVIRSRWDMDATPLFERRRRQAARNIRYLPAGTQIPPLLRDTLLGSYNCLNKQPCALYHQPGSDRAFLVAPSLCGGGSACAPKVIVYYLNGGAWSTEPPQRPDDAARQARIAEAIRQGRVEVRTVPRQQVFVGGEPVGGEID